jgi:hypothetical protein
MPREIDRRRRGEQRRRDPLPERRRKEMDLDARVRRHGTIGRPAGVADEIDGEAIFGERQRMVLHARAPTQIAEDHDGDTPGATHRRLTG